MEKTDDRRRGQCTTESRKSLLEKGSCTENVLLDVVTPSKRQLEELTPGRCLKKLKIVCGGADKLRTMPAALENEGAVFSISGPQELTCSNQVEVDKPSSAQKNLELVQHLYGGSSVPEKNSGRRTKRIGELTAKNTVKVSSMGKEAEMAIVGSWEVAAESSNTRGTKEAVDVSDLDVNEGLPFVKSLTAIWKALESSEVFQKMPQKPHFRPFQYEEELSHEELAIAKMSRFSIVVDRICKLRDPQSKFDMPSDALPELKKHGFDIEALEKLLATKASIARLEAQVKETEIWVIDKVHEKGKVAEKIEELAKTMGELAKKMDAIFKKLKVVEEHKKDEEEQKVDKDSEIVMLKSTLDNLSEQLKAAHLKFQKLADGSSEKE